MKSQEFVDKMFAAVLDSVTIDDKSGWHKITGKTNGHKIYVQKGESVKRIDTTLPVKDQPGTRGLKSPNGKVTCHLEADETTFAGFVTLLVDGSVEKLDGKPARPFAPKAPKPPKEKAAAGTEAAPVVATPGKEELAARVALIKQRAAEARARRKAEEAAEAAGAEPEEKATDDGVDLSAPDVATADGVEALRKETGVDVSVEA